MQDLRESIRWKKNRSRRRKEIDAFIIYGAWVTNLFQKESAITNRKSGTLNCIYSYPDLAPKNIVGQIWEGAYNLSFTYFWSSIDLLHLQSIKL